MNKLLVSILFIAFSYSSSEECKDGFINYYQNKCMKLIKSESNFEIATLVCEKILGSKLIELNTDLERNLIKVFTFDLKKIDNNLWIKNTSICSRLSSNGEIDVESCLNKNSFICVHEMNDESQESKKYENDMKNMNNLLTEINLIKKELNLYRNMNNDLEIIKDYLKIGSNSIENILNNGSNKSIGSFVDEENLISFLHSVAEKFNTCAVPSKILPLALNGTVETTEGENLTLKFNVTGNPKPSFSCFNLDGKRIDENEKYNIKENTLTINKINRDDYGSYHCLAENSVGVHKVYFNIIVNFPPSIIVHNPIIKTSSYEKAVLKCIIHSHPKSSVYWKKDGNIFISNNITEHYLNTTFIESRLTIDSVNTKTDLANYTCEVSNIYGSESKVIKLIGSVPKTKIVDYYQISLNEYEFKILAKPYGKILEFKLKLSCGNNKDFWLEKGYLPDEFKELKMLNNSNYLYNLNLTVFSQYNQKCRVRLYAKNEFGWSNETNEFIFNTTYLCGNSMIYATKNWQYLISHYGFGLYEPERLIKCQTLIMANSNSFIEFEFDDDGVTKRACNSFIGIYSSNNCYYDSDYICDCKRVTNKHSTSTNNYQVKMQVNRSFKLKFRSHNYTMGNSFYWSEEPELDEDVLIKKWINPIEDDDD